MQNRNRQHNESGYLMLNGPDDTLWIPRSSNKSWLTLFSLLPKEPVQAVNADRTSTSSMTDWDSSL